MVKRYRFHIIAALLLLTQIVFWYGIRIPGETRGAEDKWVFWTGTKQIKPDLGIVPPPPSEANLRAKSFGDEQFYFRIAAFNIQNAGDSFGRTTSLKKYDYSKLYEWWSLLDSLDPRSDFVPSLASYYYGATPKKQEQIPYVVQYLDEHADRDPEKKWWWYTQAVYHAKHRLDDNDLALKIARKLTAIPKEIDMPLWARQMQAFILEDQGEYKQACDIILEILDTHEELKEGEINFMMYFITERVKAMEEVPHGEVVDPRCTALYDAVKAGGY